MVKRITVSFAIILICSVTFLTGYTYVYPSYADSTTDQWNSVTTNQELGEAFRYYCKSRNLAIEGSVLDALTSFTTNDFNIMCNTLGIDVTALQAHLKRSTDSNGKIQFLFDEFGVTAFNRIFAEFLQNNDLEVGDEVEQQDIYTGKWFVDADGNGCLVTYFTGVFTKPPKFGTPYKYSTEDIISLVGSSSYTMSFNLTNSLSRSITAYYRTGQYNSFAYTTGSDVNSGTMFYINRYVGNNELAYVNKAYPVVFYESSTGKYYFGTLGHESISGYSMGQPQPADNYLCSRDVEITNNSNDPASTVIFITTNNNTINNNTYNDNKQTVINNDGDVYNYDYDDDDPPVNPPSGGGGDDPSGGGGGGTVTPPSDSGGPDGDITFPNFDFQLPEIDWSIGDVTDKFPFSIPFDLIAFFTVLNAEPRAPAIDANIPLGSWYTWHFQADFSQFNNWATIIRNVEFIAFCIGLIYLTIRLIKG